jgi:hypothetical protein
VRTGRAVADESRQLALDIGGGGVLELAGLPMDAVPADPEHVVEEALPEAVAPQDGPSHRPPLVSEGDVAAGAVLHHPKLGQAGEHLRDRRGGDLSFPREGRGRHPVAALFEAAYRLKVLFDAFAGQCVLRCNLAPAESDDPDLGPPKPIIPHCITGEAKSTSSILADDLDLGLRIDIQ